EQLGQGRENVKTFLVENPQLMAEIDERVREHLAARNDDGDGAGDEAGVVNPDEQPITLD
ncbi:MAG: DNA recombination/repair protein RecA, partial [Actinomycetota bacterium]|nr:DNA recombination/repair protein RecA [Actinomycetota bacterium]